MDDNYQIDYNNLLISQVNVNFSLLLNIGRYLLTLT